MISKRGCHPSPNSTCTLKCSLTLSVCLNWKKKKKMALLFSTISAIITPSTGPFCMHSGFKRPRPQTAWNGAAGGKSPLPQMLSRWLDAAAAASPWYTFHSHSSVTGWRVGALIPRGPGLSIQLSATQRNSESQSGCYYPADTSGEEEPPSLLSSLNVYVHFLF